MLNTGLLLRKPYESDYNAYRRFLIANQHLTASQLSAAILRACRTLTQSEEYRNRKSQNCGSSPCSDFDAPNLGRTRVRFQNTLPTLERRHELAHFLEQYHLHQHSMEDNVICPVSTPTRTNCAECARLCFHSGLYELPWLTACPIHHIPLVTLCPECQLPWPKFGELYGRQCGTCGVHIAFEELLARGAFAKGRYPGDLDWIFQAMHSPLVARLTGELAAVTEYNDIIPFRRTLRCQSRRFPSLLASLELNFTTLFIKLRLPLEPVYHFRFKQQLATVREIPYRIGTEYPAFARAARSQSRKAVIASIKRAYGNNTISPEIPPKIPISHASIGNSAHVAFQIWDRLVHLPYDYQRTRPETVPGAVLYQYPYGIPLPRTPVPLPVLRTLSQSLTHSDEVILLPEPIVKSLYQAELWQTFVAIYLFVEAIKKSAERSSSFPDIYALIDERIINHDATGFSVGFFPQEDDWIVMSIPRICLDVDAERLSAVQME